VRRRIRAALTLVAASLAWTAAVAVPVDAAPADPAWSTDPFQSRDSVRSADSTGSPASTGSVGSIRSTDSDSTTERSRCAGLLGLPPLPGVDTPRAAYDWQGDWQSREVAIPSRGTGSCLFATVFAPADASTRRLPAVVIVPAGLSTQNEFQWAARDLAGHGYVTITIDPQGIGRSDLLALPACRDGLLDCGDLDHLFPDSVLGSQAARLDAVRSGLDYLVSPANPFVRRVDPHRLGAAGHSLGGSAVGAAQEVDPRVRAVVAWDMLFARRYPTLSLDACKSMLNLAARDTRPRAPALSLTSDGGRPFCLTRDATYQKWAGFDPWRAAGVATMLVPVRGTQHMDFAQQAGPGEVDVGLPATGTEAELKVFAYYTRAWFDRHLAGDANATARLMSRRIDGRPRSRVLSTWLPSAAYLPRDGIDCKDLSRC
jgi:dienelactone hydrolase